MLTNLGRIGRSAELRKTGAGISVFTVPVAYEFGAKGQDGKRSTQWVDLSVWGKQAESLEQYMKSGQQIFFTADDVHVETYDKKDGGQAFKLVARAAMIKFAGNGKADESTSTDTPEPAPAQAQGGVPGPDKDPLDDIPFAPLHHLA